MITLLKLALTVQHMRLLLMSKLTINLIVPFLGISICLLHWNSNYTSTNSTVGQRGVLGVVPLLADAG